MSGGGINGGVTGTAGTAALETAGIGTRIAIERPGAGWSRAKEREAIFGTGAETKIHRRRRFIDRYQSFVIDPCGGFGGPERLNFKQSGTQEAVMNMMSRVTGRARSAMIGMLAFGATALILPGSAEAVADPRQIANRLERIADIRGLRRQDTAIDGLQARLNRLERITDHQRGRRARRNGKIIDRLQLRLRLMERRIEARLDRRDYRRDYRRDWGSRYGGPAVVYDGMAWRY